MDSKLCVMEELHQKQQKYNNVEEKLGKVLKIGFGTESEESGVKRMQQRYQLKQHKKIR